MTKAKMMDEINKLQKVQDDLEVWIIKKKEGLYCGVAKRIYCKVLEELYRLKKR